MTTRPDTTPPTPVVSQAQRQASCPDARYHREPFEYCGFPGCGWTEPETGQET